MTFTTTLPKANDSAWRLETKWLMAIQGWSGSGGGGSEETPANARATDDGGTRVTDDGGTRVVDV